VGTRAFSQHHFSHEVVFAGPAPANAVGDYIQQPPEWQRLIPRLAFPFKQYLERVFPDIRVIIPYL
jgi:hypothetical protein